MRTRNRTGYLRSNFTNAWWSLRATLKAYALASIHINLFFSLAPYYMALTFQTPNYVRNKEDWIFHWKERKTREREEEKKLKIHPKEMSGTLRNNASSNITFERDEAVYFLPICKWYNSNKLCVYSITKWKWDM